MTRGDIELAVMEHKAIAYAMAQMLAVDAARRLGARRA